MKLTLEQINEIAKNLQLGLKVFINTETMEIKPAGDWELDDNFNEKKWKETLEEIETHPDKYIEIEKFPPNELFAVMEGFVESVEEDNLKKQLELALSVPDSFVKFKEIIKNAGEYKEKWFSYKYESYIDWVRTQLHHYNLNLKKSTN
jgi:D-mannonate dehydratase